jgi:hypothetical protein
MYINRDMDGRPFLVYFLPILSGQKAAVSDSVEGWCATSILGASRVSIRMDDRTDGQRDDGTDSGEISFHPNVLKLLLNPSRHPSHHPSMDGTI